MNRRRTLAERIAPNPPRMPRPRTRPSKREKIDEIISCLYESPDVTVAVRQVVELLWFELKEERQHSERLAARIEVLEAHPWISGGAYAQHGEKP
jgi:hypothetical protein